ncbi:GldG family protein [Anaerotruncus rubiinfantis]|jgi:ABC-2 type transport system permease protein|uniref:GldG family protein n=1 Tax=Anaerotruncus rubiinfantis TaxID=1720200 RepID=UPI000834B433|nr:GldG family protein [Anaerotruncus rubiinfantis]
MSKKPLTIQKKTGILSSAITLIVVACLILINVVAIVATEKYPVKLDLTSSKVFQLSQESVDYLGGLDKTIDVTVMNSESNFGNSGEYYVQALAVLKQYAQYSKNIHIKYVDILANPTYAAQYPDLGLQVNDILVQCGDNIQKLTANDIFNVEQNWYGGSITSSNAEQAMTSAIMNVASDEKVKAVILSGHEESDSGAFQELLAKNGYDVSSASLLTDELPSDAAILMMVAPSRDIMEEEAKKLDAFMENGGAYGKNFLYFASTRQGSLPNLEAWLAKWGIKVGDGSVIETNPNRVISQNPFFGIADFTDTTLTGMMSNTKIPMTVPFSRPMELLFSESMGYKTKTLLSYAQSAGIAPVDAQSMDEITTSGQPIPVAVMSTYTKDAAKSNLLVFGTELVLTNSLLQSGSLSNADYLLSAVNTLTERENVISIAPKVLGGGNIVITQAEILIYAALLMIVLPLAVLIVGISIWLRRRRR